MVNSEMSQGKMPLSGTRVAGAGAFIGFERHLLAREGAADTDETALARLALTRRYAAFARETIARVGGDTDGFSTLTNRDNMVPLGDGSRPVR